MNLTQLHELMTATPDVHAPLESVIYSLTMNVKKGSRYRHSDTATLPDGTTIRASTDGYVVERNGAAHLAPTAQDAARLASAPVSTALVAVGSAVTHREAVGRRRVRVEAGGVYCAEFSDLCARMPDASADMILCDLPYGTTACAWDSVIPFEIVWTAFKRIIKPRGAIVLTAGQPFTSALVMSNPEMFRYEWIWRKNQATGMMNARFRPLKEHESVLVFSSLPTRANQFSDDVTAYYPQGLQPAQQREKSKTQVTAINNLRGIKPGYYIRETTNFPKTVLEFDVEIGYHQTQKPVTLFEYLIRTYTQAGELVFDPTCGSGTTAVAAKLSGREFIVGDQNAECAEITRQRVASIYSEREQASQIEMFTERAS